MTFFTYFYFGHSQVLRYNTAFKNTKSTLTFQKLLYPLYKDLYKSWFGFSWSRKFVSILLIQEILISLFYNIKRIIFFLQFLRNTPNHLVNLTKITFAIIQSTVLILMVCQFLLAFPCCSRTFNISRIIWL